MFRISNIALAIALGTVSKSHAFAPSGTFGVQRYANFLNNIAAQEKFFLNSGNTQLFLAAGVEESIPTKLVRKPDSNVEITLTASGKSTKAAYDAACAEMGKSLSIPGFRKGAKIPAAVIENAVAAKGGKNALRTQAIQTLLNQMLESALKDEHNLEPIGQPTLVTATDELAEKFKPGEPIEIVVACDVWPDIKWKKVDGKEKPYMGLTGKYSRKPFNQKRMDQALKDLAERYAVTSPAPKGKVLEMGDACVVDMEGFMAAADGVSKGEPLPAAASGENVEVVLGPGRYMEGLVEGLIGAKVGETKTVYVSFPTGLRDKTLAGKKAVFDVTIKESNIRTVPEIDDELASKIRPGLNADGLLAELRKAVDEQDIAEWTQPRNKALSKALAEVMDVEVPDTLVTNQAREKYAQMMAEFRTGGMSDDEIKKQITPENFLKYKNIEKADIIADFKTSMAVDEIARIEGIQVPDYQIDEQMEALKKEASGEDLGDESILRTKIESTISRRLVFDFLADNANLTVEYTDEPEIDEALLEKLAADTLKREEEMAAKAVANQELPISDVTTEVKKKVDVEATAAAKAAAEAKKKANEEAIAAKLLAEKKAQAKAAESSQRSLLAARLAREKSEKDVIMARIQSRRQPKSPEEALALKKKYGAIEDVGERAFQILVDLGMVDITPEV